MATAKLKSVVSEQITALRSALPPSPSYRFTARRCVLFNPGASVTSCSATTLHPTPPSHVSYVAITARVIIVVGSSSSSSRRRIARSGKYSGVQAIGVGSNKDKREKACKVAFCLRALASTKDFAKCVFFSVRYHLQ